MPEFHGDRDAFAGAPLNQNIIYIRNVWSISLNYRSDSLHVCIIKMNIHVVRIQQNQTHQSCYYLFFGIWFYPAITIG